MSTSIKLLDLLKIAGVCGKVGSSLNFKDSLGNEWNLSWYEDNTIREFIL